MVTLYPLTGAVCTVIQRPGAQSYGAKVHSVRSRGLEERITLCSQLHAHSPLLTQNVGFLLLPTRIVRPVLGVRDVACETALAEPDEKSMQRLCLCQCSESAAVCLLVACLLNMRVYFRDGSAQTILRAATLR